VHGVKLLDEEDLGAPACNDCHGNHGAVPPDVESLEQVCGSCHVNNQSFFENSPMEAPFREDELHACLECHGYHDVAKTFDDMVGVGPESVCMNCHSEGEKAYDVAQTIHSQLTALTAVSDSASTMQSEVVRIGMDDVDIEFLLKQAHQSLVQARTLVHTFDPEKVGEAVDDGKSKAREAIATSKAEIQDNKNRRLGFGLASLFITLLVVGLYLKIRDVDARMPS
jgi:predicted CXXCH cytochrome family protein